eukprot:COSAG02_NODE_42034_length_388_cov_1.062284_2_plen_40_part_01
MFAGKHGVLYVIGERAFWMVAGVLQHINDNRHNQINLVAC